MRCVLSVAFQLAFKVNTKKKIDTACVKTALPKSFLNPMLQLRCISLFLKKHSYLMIEIAVLLTTFVYPILVYFPQKRKETITDIFRG